jgi:hypothetical protein
VVLRLAADRLGLDLHLLEDVLVRVPALHLGELEGALERVGAEPAVAALVAQAAVHLERLARRALEGERLGPGEEDELLVELARLLGGDLLERRAVVVDRLVVLAGGHRGVGLPHAGRLVAELDADDVLLLGRCRGLAAGFHVGHRLGGHRGDLDLDLGAALEADDVLGLRGRGGRERQDRRERRPRRPCHGPFHRMVSWFT